MFGRSAKAEASARVAPVVHQLASLLLRHPDEVAPLHDAIAETIAGLPEDLGTPLRTVLAHLENRTTPADRLARANESTEIFDFTRTCCMYLTYFPYGDTRQRGAALLRFTAAYKAAGLELDSGELPDYLPLVLEFAATGDQVAGPKLLASFRASLDVLHDGLTDQNSPYRHAIEAVRLTLPLPTQRDLTLAERLRVDGPPKEDVGLGELGSATYSLDPALAQHSSDADGPFNLTGAH